MRTPLLLACALLVAVSSVSQNAPQIPAQPQCRFSDGTKISVSYSLERKSYLFTTDGSLVTVRGIRVPSGEYAVSLVKDQDSNWTLRMGKQVLKRGVWMLPPLPMSVATKALPVDGLIVFDQTGGSCLMYWRQRDSAPLLSLEFTRENSDMPVSD